MTLQLFNIVHINKPKSSIIVPFYNTEYYLCPCLNSIFAQSFTDLEAILVDDSSTDKSGQMCAPLNILIFYCNAFAASTGLLIICMQFPITVSAKALITIL